MKDLPTFTGTFYDHLYVFGIIVFFVGGAIWFFVGCDRDVFPTCNGITFVWIGMGIMGVGVVMFVAGWLFNGRAP